jgi:DNA modification methylase
MSTSQSNHTAALSATNSPAHSLRPNPRNPRVHSDRQIKQIARSIKAFGFNTPILADRNNQIIAGHGRLLAAQQLGWTEVPVIRLEHLTEAQARAFALADNRLTENSTWDEKLLGEIFLELSTQDLEFSIDDTGFTMGEIDLHIEGITAVENKSDPMNELPAPSNQPPVCQPGELWLLGKHRIYCGNSLEAASYDALMQGQKANLVFTDPPYNVPIEGHVSGHGAVKHREFSMAAGEMSEAEFTEFLSKAFTHLATHSQSGSIHYICMDWRHIGETLAAGKTCYAELKNICVWVKDKGGMGSLYRSQHELVLIFKHGKASHRNNVELGKFGRYRTNVWNYPGANTLSRQGTEGNLLALHPTVKPIALIADAILDCSARGDIVLDSFLGSGTTILAAERVGRIAYGIEIDPLYVDTAIRRWQAHTGEHAIHTASEKCFDELASLAEIRHE